MYDHREFDECDTGKPSANSYTSLQTMQRGFPYWKVELNEN